MTASILEGYVSEHEAADDLRVSKRTMERWHRLGEGPRRTYIGRRVYYSRRAIADWLASREQEVEAGAA